MALTKRYIIMNVSACGYLWKDPRQIDFYAWFFDGKEATYFNSYEDAFKWADEYLGSDELVTIIEALES